MGIITFNGMTSSSYGIVVEHFPDYEYPERDYTVTHVPGRNGDIVVDNGSYQNVKRTYQIAIGATSQESFSDISRKISRWLHEPSTYARLEDTYEPDVYRLAYYDENNKIENVLDRAGRAEISFVCKPQKYLKSGEIPLSYPNDGNNIYLWNSTAFNSKPIITIHPARDNSRGIIWINDKAFIINNMMENQAITIDSELEDVYDAETKSINLNSKIDFIDFPEFKPYSNVIRANGFISHIDIIPRWWTL